MPVAVITGASRGFGRELARSLASDGWDLVLNARRADLLAAVRDELVVLGVSVDAIAGDVADAGHRTALVHAASARGGLDLVVNNASTLGPTPLVRLDALSLEAFRDTLEVNVVAPLALVQRALPLLRRSRGVIVGVSSDAAVEGYEGW